MLKAFQYTIPSKEVGNVIPFVGQEQGTFTSDERGS
jgi:hypothetical protein